MPRGGTFLGSLRSLLGTSRSVSQKLDDTAASSAPRATLSIVSDSTTPKLAPMFDEDIGHVSGASVANGVKAPSPRSVVPKAFHRTFFSRSYKRTQSPTTVSEVEIHHARSDDLNDTPQKNRSALQDRKEHSYNPDLLCTSTKMSRLTLATRRLDVPVSIPTAPLPYDSSRNCMSLDIPTVPLSSSSPLDTHMKSQLLMKVATTEVTLDSADMMALVASPELPCALMQGAMEGPPSHLTMMMHLTPPVQRVQPPMPPPMTPTDTAPSSSSSSSMLLALCPAVPDAMRRRHWCVEDFVVTRKLYKGATSTVYKATCRHSELPVALKVYFLSKVPSNVIHMVVREIKIHVGLVHKNVVMLYAAFQDEKRLVLVQEFAGRGDLYGIHQSLNRRMSEEQLTKLVLGPFMEALSYLHARGICHRDVKPENILFTHDWRLLVADFGVSIDLNQERAVTRAGTLDYMAPEVERCPLKMLPEENKENADLAYTTAVDIWAIGVLAYEMIVGFAPFVVDNQLHPGASGGAVVTSIRSHLRKLSFPSSTSAAARDFITASLAERPEERPTAMQLSRHPWLTGATQQEPQ